MPSLNLYIYGAGGMADVVADTAQLLGWRILAFVDDTPTAPQIHFGINVVSKLPPPEEADNQVICAIGDCDARLRICESLRQCGYHLATLIHPSAVVSRRAQLAAGVFIAAGAVIDPNVVIHEYTIINNNAVISHGTHIGKACHIAPQSAISGNCQIGDAVWLGIGSKIIERITIDKRAFIGAGAVVVRNISANTVAYGVPAKEVKQR